MHIVDECALVRNVSLVPARLVGFVVRDAVGGHESAPLGDYEIAPNATFNLWTRPGVDGFDLEESAANVFWRNKGNGAPRRSSVLNNDGDGLLLIAPDGTVVASFSVDGKTEDDEEQEEDQHENQDHCTSASPEHDSLSSLGIDGCEACL